jgi:hypothetical protein
MTLFSKSWEKFFQVFFVCVMGLQSWDGWEGTLRKDLLGFLYIAFLGLGFRYSNTPFYALRRC